VETLTVRGKTQLSSNVGQLSLCVSVCFWPKKLLVCLLHAFEDMTVKYKFCFCTGGQLFRNCRNSNSQAFFLDDNWANWRTTGVCLARDRTLVFHFCKRAEVVHFWEVFDGHLFHGLSDPNTHGFDRHLYHSNANLNK
jgi:hypothetical protein